MASVNYMLCVLFTLVFASTRCTYSQWHGQWELGWLAFAYQLLRFTHVQAVGYPSLGIPMSNGKPVVF